MSKENRIES